MRSVHTIVIGGGQAGLAMSHCLDERGVEHVVLERGRIAERWRSERWDSLKLLTPRWQSRLPGWSYRGPDPHGFMSRGEVVRYLERYARSFTAPIETGVNVERVERAGFRFRVWTDRGVWIGENVVIATGDCDLPYVPPLAKDLSGELLQVVPTEYKNPGRLPEGGVLVVGASATGVQLASEIHASGRPVTLAVGRHTRLPRRYRGADILWWLDRMGVLDERADEVRDHVVSRGQPSLQLVGSADHRSLDLGVLMREGVRVVGRAVGADGHTISLADDLVETTVSADVKLARLRMRIDEHVRSRGLDGLVHEPEPFERIDPPAAPTRLDLRAAGIRSVVWATGYRTSYPWLHVPVVSPRGEIVHSGGVTAEPGLYVVGLRFLRRRNSSFIDGQSKDAPEIAEHIATCRSNLSPTYA